MRDERVYHEYVNWKIENHDLLKYLTDNNSDLIIRSRHIMDVVEHFYDKLVDDIDYSEEDDNIFKTGFYYLAEQIEEIKRLMEKAYQNDVKYLEKRAKDVNLMLNAVDFYHEVSSVENRLKSDSDDLEAFIIEVTQLLEDKEDIPKYMFEKLDKITYEMYNRLDIRDIPLNAIFLEIADELGIL